MAYGSGNSTSGDSIVNINMTNTNRRGMRPNHFPRNDNRNLGSSRGRGYGRNTRREEQCRSNQTTSPLIQGRDCSYATPTQSTNQNELHTPINSDRDKVNVKQTKAKVGKDKDDVIMTDMSTEIVNVKNSKDKKASEVLEKLKNRKKERMKMNRKYKGLQHALTQKKIISKEYLRKQYTIFDFITRAEVLATVHGVSFVDDTLPEEIKWKSNNVMWILIVEKPFIRTTVTLDLLFSISTGGDNDVYQMEVCSGHHDIVIEKDNDNKDPTISGYSPSSLSIHSFTCDGLHDLSYGLDELKISTAIFDETDDDGVSSTTNEDNKPLCTKCNKVIDRFNIELLNRAKNIHKQNIVSNINSSSVDMCINCCTSFFQNMKQVEKSKHLNNIMHRIVYHSEKPYWNMDNKQECNLSSFLKLFVPRHDELLKDKYYSALCSDTLEYVVYENDCTLSPKKYNERGLAIEGGFMDKSFTPDLLDNCAIEAPKDGSIGVMRFHDKCDFLMFVPTDMNKTDILSFSKEETQFMKTLSKGGRAGAAGGVVDIDTDSHSISSGVQKDTMILVPRPKGVGVSLIYKNKFDEVNAVNSIYNDIYMQSLKKKAESNKIIIVIQAYIDL